MGSDWIWELEVPAAAGPALHQFFELAAERDLHRQRPDGLINLFGLEPAGPRTVDDPHAALTAIATGGESGQLWTTGGTDIFVSWKNGTLTWSLDAAFCFREPVPRADTFRELHARLTGLWRDTAQQVSARSGRILDEWSTEQVWHLGIHDGVHPIGGWPAELGWWTYLGAAHRLPPPPLSDVAARAQTLPDNALLITLLDDPAAVDTLRYLDIHTRWLRAPLR